MTLPQLRVRTEFSFRSGGPMGGVSAYGPLPKVVERLVEIGSPAAGIVDGSTWGHTRWARACAKTPVAPMFGVELPIPQPDGRRPTAWALAVDSRALYRFSTAARVEGADREALFRDASGLIRFAGTALKDPSTFDYVDLNPGSARSALAAVRLADSTGKPLVLTSDNSYPRPRDKSAFLAIGGREAVTPQHLLSVDELAEALVGTIGHDAFDLAIAGTHAAAALAARKLETAQLISVKGDLRREVKKGIEFRLKAGHIGEWTAEYAERVERELKMIESKRFESYFLVVSDLVRWAKTKMLVGPARGSSAGSLVCYVLRITEVDPLVHNLLFERFIDVTRHDLPDIDIDFSDTKREKVFVYLAKKYGREKVARLGNVSTLKPKSAIHEVGKRLGIPSSDTFDLMNVLVEYSSGDSRYGKGLEDTMTGTAPGRAFAAKHPAAKVMTEVENHAWHTGIHAAGVIVCNDPISDYATVDSKGIAQIDKPAAEDLGLLKIDALGLRTLGVIEDSGVVTADQLYALPLNDPEVFSIFNQKKYSGIFQFEGATQRGVSAAVHIDSFRKIDHVTALARPGPLGGGASHHYIARAAGREPVTFRHPSMEPYLGPTMGVILYQEQVMRISFEIGRFSWEVVSEIRKSMSGRKGKEYFDRRGAEFVAGAATIGVGKEDAETIWNEINTFGAWGMNASHTVSYGIISYWCAYLKRYHPLEYAAACLRGAKDDEQAMEVLREMVAEGVRYIPFDIERSEITWSVKDGDLLGGFQNIRGIGPIHAAKYAAARAAGTLDAKTRAKIAAMPVKFADLRPAHTLWGHIYDDPESYNVDGEVGEFATLPDQSESRRGSCVAIGLIKKRVRRDRNESILVRRRRGGEMATGQTLFLDVMVVDDSVSKPVIARINERLWDEIGSKIADSAVDEEDWLLLRGRWLKEFNMMLVQRVRCLTRPEILK